MPAPGKPVGPPHPPRPPHGAFQRAAARTGVSRGRLSRVWSGDGTLSTEDAIAVLNDPELGPLVDLSILTGVVIPPGTMLAPGVFAVAVEGD